MDHLNVECQINTINVSYIIVDSLSRSCIVLFVIYYFIIIFLARNQEGKVISGTIRWLWDYENATKEAETN